MLKKIIFSGFMLGAFLGLNIQGSVNAQLDEICSSRPNAAACRDNSATSGRGAGLYGPNGLLTRIARLLSVIAGASAVFIIMLAGFKYVTASGDPSNVNEAKNMILYAVIGLIIAAMAQILIVFVLDKLPG